MKFFVCGILGVPGSGKTVFAERMLRGQKRVIIIDYQHDEAFDHYEIITSLSELRAATVSYNEFNIVFRGKKDVDYYAAIDYITEVRNVVILLDELSVYAPVRETPESIKELFFRGRRKGQVLIWTAQRAYTVSLDVRSVTHTFVVFQTQEERDLRYLQIEKKDYTKLRKLRVGQYIIVRSERMLIDYLKEP